MSICHHSAGDTESSRDDPWDSEASQSGLTRGPVSKEEDGVPHDDTLMQAHIHLSKTSIPAQLMDFIKVNVLYFKATIKNFLSWVCMWCKYPYGDKTLMPGTVFDLASTLVSEARLLNQIQSISFFCFLRLELQVCYKAHLALSGVLGVWNPVLTLVQRALNHEATSPAFYLSPC